MVESKRGLLSIVVPVFNEEDNVEILYNTVTRVMDLLSDRYDYEFVFTDNHSTDQTFEKLERLSQREKRVKVLRFSRNFGYQRSIYTGYINASGDAAVQLDCDLQDPPELILEFVRHWEAGYQVVYGVRRSRKESWWINSVRKAFYWIIDTLSEDTLPHDAGDFRLVDRIVLDELKKIEDYQPYLRGAIAAMGFKQVGILYDRAERTRGRSKFSRGDLIRLAMDGILNHSVVPLRIATFTGLAVSLLTFFGIVAYIIGRLLFGQQWPAGFATTTTLILLSLSLNALFLGIIGEYLGRIYQQVKKRPITIIEREIDPRAKDRQRERVH
ncbi:MAG: glycosyltransferase family 2 protein [Actinobacteria bacterium]|nr:glycosyltransferase family 2 protein [Actinomycetota bacterium]